MAHRKKVLVIDDDAATCELIEQTLEQLGFEVTTTQDARTGFETAQRLLPELIFLRLLLPGIDGMKVSKAIHTVPTLKNVPVIMIVAQQGELDPKYTATIGIVDILVRPMQPHEIIAKTKAVLGEMASASSRMELVTLGLDEEEIEPVMVIDTYEAAEDAMRVSAVEDGLDRPRHYGEQENGKTPGSVRVMEDEEESDLLPRALHYAWEEGLREERDLFSEVTASSEDEMKTVRDENGYEPEVHGISDNPSGDEDPVTGDVPPSLVRRGLLIGASVIAGIALGIGGYLFFSAGDKQVPARKQVTKVLPGPAAVVPAAPGAPARRQDIIPEIPVKQEPSVPDTAGQAETPRQKPVPAVVKTAAGPAGAQKESATKESADGDILAGSYDVQAGVFESKDNADALAAKIRKAGIAASILKVESSGTKRLYRVYAETAASHNRALQMSESLRRKGINTFVRQSGRHPE
jgi:DNA-binding response OmpR family regulator